jgi:hypothetical protein
MIKKSVFEDELIAGMQKRLAQPEVDEAMEHIVDAADLLNAAAEIFEEAGMTKQADKVLSILAKIAIQHHQEKEQHKARKAPVDHATKGLTPQKMIQNLLHHGTEFNMADDNSADDLLNADIDDKSLEVNEKDPLHEMDFEDEI